MTALGGLSGSRFGLYEMGHTVFLSGSVEGLGFRVQGFLRDAKSSSSGFEAVPVAQKSYLFKELYNI